MRDDEHVSETDLDDDENDENAFVHVPSVPPLSHARDDSDALRDITDQFFHPPSPSPVRVAEPPRRPKKPKSLAFPADPPNWLYVRSSSSLPPSSPLPPSTVNVDTRHEYHLGTPSKASDSDPFGFVAVERVLKAKRVPKSPPRSTVLAPILSSLSQIELPIPTNNEDIDGLYDDEPVAGPSHVQVPVAPLLMMNSDQPHVELDATGSQRSFSDPLRTPRKRKRRASPTPDGDGDSDDQESSAPSSPSPVKVSVGVGARSVLKVTRAQSRAAGTSKLPGLSTTQAKHVKKSYQDIPTPSSTPVSVRRSSRQSAASSPTPVPPRRSTRQATIDARAARSSTATHGEDRGSRMKLRSRSTKETMETKTTQAKPAPSKSKTRTTTTTTAKPARGRPKGKKDTKGKGKARALENVLELSDDTRERYEKERRERIKYFKRLEEYQIQKENVYVV